MIIRPSKPPVRLLDSSMAAIALPAKSHKRTMFEIAGFRHVARFGLLCNYEADIQLDFNPLYILIGFPIHIDTISLGLTIEYMKIFFLNYDVFIIPLIVLF